MSHLSDRHHKETGQGLVEYALLLMLVATVVVAALALVGSNTGNVFSNIACSLHQDGQCPAASSANSNQNTNTSNQNTNTNASTNTNPNPSSSGNCGNGNGNGNGASNGCGNSNSSGSGNCGNGNGNGNGASNGCGNGKRLPTQRVRDAHSLQSDANKGL
jgi:Flp pilus assembly pilin Flp